jgi:hypothetical protein
LARIADILSLKGTLNRLKILYYAEKKLFFSIVSLWGYYAFGLNSIQDESNFSSTDSKYLKTTPLSYLGCCHLLQAKDLL